jgi:hypothetical protein
MKQSRQLIRAPAMLEALQSPACEKCQALTRFVGLEAHPHNESFDLSTYQCVACGHMQIGVTSRDEKQNGIEHPAA